MKVKGVSFRPQALLSVLGPKSEWTGYAALLPQVDNPHDPTAVSVWTDGYMIGFVPRDSAARIHTDLMAMIRDGEVVGTRAKLNSTTRGWH